MLGVTSFHMASRLGMARPVELGRDPWLPLCFLLRRALALFCQGNLNLDLPRKREEEPGNGFDVGPDLAELFN